MFIKNVQIRPWSLKETGTSHIKKLFMQIIRDKILEQSKEIKQTWTRTEIFDNCSCVIFDNITSVFFGKKTEHEALSPPNFNIFLIFAKILSLKSFSNLWGNSHTMLC